MARGWGSGLLRGALVVCALTWWFFPGFGVIDLSVTWNPAWDQVLEGGWGVLFTVGLGLPFLIAAVRPRIAGAALIQLYLVTAYLLMGVVAGLEYQAVWIFVLLLIELPILRALHAPMPALARPHRVLLVLCAVAAAPTGAYAWHMATLNRQSLPDADITVSVDHYAVQAAVALTMFGLPLFAAFLPAARRLLGTSAALMAGYLGLVSLAWPDAAGGFSAFWSVAAMGWAAAVVVASWWPVASRPGSVEVDVASRPQVA